MNREIESPAIESAVVVVPCYNEEKRLNGQEFLDFLGDDRSFHFLFVNDGSKDGTASVLEKLCARAPDNLRWLDLDRNRGKAEAVRRGVLMALTEAPGAIAFWDADLATPLSELPAFAEVLQRKPQLEVVVGSRVRLMGRRIDRKLTRHLLGRVFATVASLTLGLPFYDTQCGAKMFRVTQHTEELFAQEFGSRWLFDVEICARLIRAMGHEAVGRAIYEYPLREWLDVEGSKLHKRDFLRAAVELHGIYRKYPELRDR